MKIKALRPLLHDAAGAVPAGAVADIPEPWASRFIERGHAERYETKVVREKPAEPADDAPENKAAPRKTTKKAK